MRSRRNSWRRNRKMRDERKKRKEEEQEGERYVEETVEDEE